MEIETDKTTVGVPSPAHGIIEEIFVTDGDTVKAGQQLFRMKVTGEAPKAAAAAPTPAAAPPAAAAPPPQAPKAAVSLKYLIHQSLNDVYVSNVLLGCPTTTTSSSTTSTTTTTSNSTSCNRSNCCYPSCPSN